MTTALLTTYTALKASILQNELSELRNFEKVKLNDINLKMIKTF